MTERGSGRHLHRPSIRVMESWSHGDRGGGRYDIASTKYLHSENMICYVDAGGGRPQQSVKV